MLFHREGVDNVSTHHLVKYLNKARMLTRILKLSNGRTVLCEKVVTQNVLKRQSLCLKCFYLSIEYFFGISLKHGLLRNNEKSKTKHTFYSNMITCIHIMKKNPTKKFLRENVPAEMF